MLHFSVSILHLFGYLSPIFHHPNPLNHMVISPESGRWKMIRRKSLVCSRSDQDNGSGFLSIQLKKLKPLIFGLKNPRIVQKGSSQCPDGLQSAPKLTQRAGWSSLGAGKKQLRSRLGAAWRPQKAGKSHKIIIL